MYFPEGDPANEANEQMGDQIKILIPDPKLENAGVDFPKKMILGKRSSAARNKNKEEDHSL